MTKKNCLPITLLLGISLVFLVIVTAITFAETCNKYKRSDQKTEGQGCNIFSSEDYCTYPGQPPEDCSDDKQGVKPKSLGTTQRYFGRTMTENRVDHAIEAGSLVCGYVYNCISGINGECGYGTQAISPTTGQQIERTRVYYDNDNCSVE